MYRIHSRRAAFTLIELLVVIAIIAILSSLLLGGVMFILRKGPEVQNRNDILQLSTALQRFQSENKFYPPSKIRLCSNRAQYGASPLDQISLQAINTIWPNITIANLNWSGNGSGKDDFILEGDQCLVFFLGGIPAATGGVQGFSRIATNPTAPGGDRNSYFSFNPGRLALRVPGNPFPSYIDSHQKIPFAYFSSGRRPDGYDLSHAIAGLGVGPYIQQTVPTTKFYNSTSFQLISAGPDFVFGPGGPWVPGGGNQATKDDISNFHDSKLGAS